LRPGSSAPRASTGSSPSPSSSTKPTPRCKEVTKPLTGPSPYNVNRVTRRSAYGFAGHLASHLGGGRGRLPRKRDGPPPPPVVPAGRGGRGGRGDHGVDRSGRLARMVGFPAGVGRRPVRAATAGPSPLLARPLGIDRLRSLDRP